MKQMHFTTESFFVPQAWNGAVFCDFVRRFLQSVQFFRCAWQSALQPAPLRLAEWGKQQKSSDGFHRWVFHPYIRRDFHLVAHGIQLFLTKNHTGTKRLLCDFDCESGFSNIPNASGTISWVPSGSITWSAFDRSMVDFASKVLKRKAFEEFIEGRVAIWCWNPPILVDTKKPKDIEKDAKLW